MFPSLETAKYFRARARTRSLTGQTDRSRPEWITREGSDIRKATPEQLAIWVNESSPEDWEGEPGRYLAIITEIERLLVET